MGFGQKKKATAMLTTEGLRFIKIERRLRSSAADFEALRKSAGDVSHATLKRDLKTMREELAAPIHWDATEALYFLAPGWAGVAAILLEQVAEAH